MDLVITFVGYTDTRQIFENWLDDCLLIRVIIIDSFSYLHQ